MSSIVDTDLVKKAKKTAEKLTENFYHTVNEPCLACYRINEHVNKSGPLINDKRIEMKKLEKRLKNECYDLDYAIEALKEFQKSEPIFKNIKELIKDTYFYKQQIDHDRIRLRADFKDRNKKTSLQRFSGSFDINSVMTKLPSSPSTSMMTSNLKRSESVDTEASKALKES